ncbi:MAG: hypothetical protein ACRDZW_08330 [Acidimicrobiales bacterium]
MPAQAVGRRHAIAVAIVTMALGGTACGGGGGSRDEAACDAYTAVQASLRAATVQESPATLATVERRLVALSGAAEGRAQLDAARRAAQGWKAFRTLSASVPRDEFTTRQAYFAALGPLDVFTKVCGLAP